MVVCFVGKSFNDGISIIINNLMYSRQRERREHERERERECVCVCVHERVFEGDGGECV